MRRRRPYVPAPIKRLDKAFDRVEMSVALAIRAHEFPDGTEQRLAYEDLSKLLQAGGDTARMNISTLARQVGLPYKEVVTAYRDYQRLEGIVAVASRVPEVMAGIAHDALPTFSTCPVCKGTRRVATKVDEAGLPIETEKCIPCEGEGRIRKPGDPLARKQVLEMMDLAGPRATPIITNSNVVMTGGSLEDTLRAARSSATAAIPERTPEGTLRGSPYEGRPAGVPDVPQTVEGGD